MCVSKKAGAPFLLNSGEKNQSRHDQSIFLVSSTWHFPLLSLAVGSDTHAKCTLPQKWNQENVGTWGVKDKVDNTSPPNQWIFNANLRFNLYVFNKIIFHTDGHSSVGYRYQRAPVEPAVLWEKNKCIYLGLKINFACVVSILNWKGCSALTIHLLTSKVGTTNYIRNQAW